MPLADGVGVGSLVDVWVTVQTDAGPRTTLVGEGLAVTDVREAQAVARLRGRSNGLHRGAAPRTSRRCSTPCHPTETSRSSPREADGRDRGRARRFVSWERMRSPRPSPHTRGSPLSDAVRTSRRPSPRRRPGWRRSRWFPRSVTLTASRLASLRTWACGWSALRRATMRRAHSRRLGSWWCKRTIRSGIAEAAANAPAAAEPVVGGPGAGDRGARRRGVGANGSARAHVDGREPRGGAGAALASAAR